MILDLIQERAHLKTYDDAKEVVWALYYTKYNRYTQWIRSDNPNDIIS